MIALALAALSAVRNLFGGSGSAGSSLKAIGVAAAVAVALAIGWQGVAFVRTASADHAAVAVLAGERDRAVSVANNDAVALASSRQLHDDILISAQAAAAADRTRSASLEADLENIRHAPHSSCVPSAAARGLLQRLRQ